MVVFKVFNVDEASRGICFINHFIKSKFLVTSSVSVFAVKRGRNGCGCALSSIDNPAEVCRRSDPALNAGDLLCQTELESLQGTVHCGQILQAWESLPHGACLFWPSIVLKGRTLCHKHTDIS